MNSGGFIARKIRWRLNLIATGSMYESLDEGHRWRIVRLGSPKPVAYGGSRFEFIATLLYNDGKGNLINVASGSNTWDLMELAESLFEVRDLRGDRTQPAHEVPGGEV